MLHNFLGENFLNPEGRREKHMTYYYILKDGVLQGRTASKESAIDLIRQYQAMEKHFLKAEFSIIEGKAEETIKYQ